MTDANFFDPPEEMAPMQIEHGGTVYTLEFFAAPVVVASENEPLPDPGEWRLFTADDPEEVVWSTPAVAGRDRPVFREEAEASARDWLTEHAGR
jgi:hypothetical protein